MLNVRDTWGKQLLQTTAPDRRNDSGTASETNLHLAWQLTGDTKNLDKLYASQIETAVDREFINTEGSLWIDRIYFNNGELQRARLGGCADANYVYPGNVVSWKFDAPAKGRVSASLYRGNTGPHQNHCVQPRLRSSEGAHDGMGDRSGQVGDRQGVEGTSTDVPSGEVSTRTEEFERSRDLEITFRRTLRRCLS